MHFEVKDEVSPPAETGGFFSLKQTLEAFLVVCLFSLDHRPLKASPLPPDVDFWQVNNGHDGA